MIYQVIVRPAARFDIAEAESWYNKQQPGVGGEFSETIEAAIDSLAETPLTHAIRIKRKSIRWFVAPRFPYKVVYRIEGQSVVVVAVTHTARDDRTWLKRI